MRTRTRTRRGLLAGGAAVITVAAGLAVVVANTSGDAARPVAVLGGEPVTSTDWSYYRGLAEDGTIPTGTDRDALLARIADDRALFALAREERVTGTVPDLQTLLARRGAANSSRAADAGAGTVVYGAGNYDVGEFYTRTLAQLRTATLTALSDGPRARLQVSAAAVRAELRAHPQSWSAAATTYRLTSLEVPGTVRGRSGQALAQQAACVALNRAAATVPGARSGSRTIVASALANSGLSPDAQAQLTSAPVGTCLDAVPLRGTWVRYRVDARRVDERVALRAYSTQIRQVLLERGLETLIHRTAARLLRHN